METPGRPQTNPNSLANLDRRGRFKVLTDKEVDTLKVLCRLQCTYDEICLAMHVSKTTLIQMRSRDNRVLMAMNEGYAQGRINLRSWMMKSAEKNVIMQIFLAKNILGFRDITDHRMSIEDMGEKLSIEQQRQRLVDMLFSAQSELPEPTNGFEEADIIDVTPDQPEQPAEDKKPNDDEQGPEQS